MASRTRPPSPALSILAAAWAGCGGAGPTPADPSVAPAVEILSYTASAPSVAWRETSWLEWKVAHATSVELVGPDGPLVSSGELEGRVETGPILRTSRFTLTARGAGAPATRVLFVTLAPPRVERFTVAPERAALGGPCVVEYAVSNAAQVRLLQDERVLLDVPTPASAALDGRLERVADAAVTIYTLEVTNPSGTARAARRVTADLPPEIRRFAVGPRALFGAPASVRVRWAVEGADAVALRLDGAEDPRLPPASTGTVTLALAAPGELALEATRGEARVREVWRVGPPSIELEPNDNLEGSTALGDAAAAVGALASARDVDVYTYAPRRPGRFRVTTTGPEGAGCMTNTALRITEWGGALLALDSEHGAPAPGGGACAAAEVAVGAPLGPPVPFVIVVTGEGGAIGGYAVVVEDL